MEIVVLTAKNIEEIFLAFVGAGDSVPSGELLRALASHCGKTEEILREEYKAYYRSIAATTADPFDH